MQEVKYREGDLQKREKGEGLGRERGLQTQRPFLDPAFFFLCFKSTLFFQGISESSSLGLGHMAPEHMNLGSPQAEMFEPFGALVALARSVWWPRLGWVSEQ